MYNVLVSVFNVLCHVTRPQPVGFSQYRVGLGRRAGGLGSGRSVEIQGVSKKRYFLDCVTQLKLDTGEKLSSSIFYCLSVSQ